MKEKNPMSCFDDDIGDDFLSAWKPSKMNSVPNLDFDCSQLNASEKTFKLSENFDLDIPDFGTGLNSKLSSFDIDLDFLQSPKHGDSVKENCREALIIHSQTSSDALQASSGHDHSSFPGELREDVAAKKCHVEEKRHDQADAKIMSKAGDTGKTLTWGSQIEMAKTPLDSGNKRVLKETGYETIKGTTHDSSFSKSYEGAASTQGWHAATEPLDSVRETCKQPGEGAIGHKNASSLSAMADQQGKILSSAQAVSKENDKVAGEIVSDKNTEEVTPKHIETKTERRSFREMLQGVKGEQSFELQSAAEEVAPKQIDTITERRSFRGTLQGATKETQSALVAEEVTTNQIETITERRSFRGALQGITKESHLEVQAVGVAINVENATVQTDLQPSACYKKSGKSFEIQEEKDQTKQADREPWKDIAAGQKTKTFAAEHTQESKTSSMLTKDLNKLDALNSSSPLGSKFKSAAPKNSLSKAFMSLKPTQVSALRTSRSHALPPLRFEKQIGDPAFKADDEELQTNLKAQAIIETEQRSSLQTSRPPLTRIKKRGPPPLEQPAVLTQASADVPKRSVNETPEKRPKLQAAHRTEQESNELQLLNAGQGKMTKMSIPAIEKLNLSKNISQAVSHSRPPSSLSRLTSLTRLQHKDHGPTSAARIELPRPEDIFVVTNSLCVQSSLSHGQAVDPAAAEIVKKTELEMNHKPESIYHGLRRTTNLVSHSLPKINRDNLTDAMIDKCEIGESTGYHEIDEKKGSHPPLKDSRGSGHGLSEMHDDAACKKVTFEVSCPPLLLEDIMQGQTCAKEITHDRKSVPKTTAYYSVELDKIMSKLKQKQRRANDFLAEAMAHNAKMKYLLNPKNQEKHIIILQNSIAERLEEVKQQAAGNRARKCEWCEEHREDGAAALIKAHCNTVH